MWKVIGESINTADLTTHRVHQQAVPSRNTIVNGCRAYFIFYNDPAFTSMTMKIYSNRTNTPTALIATSTNSVLKSDILLTDTHGVREIYFDFNSVNLKANDLYHFVPYINGYTGNDSSHIAWKHSYPDPAYQESVDMTFPKQLISPFDLTIIGSYL